MDAEKAEKRRREKERQTRRAAEKGEEYQGWQERRKGKQEKQAEQVSSCLGTPVHALVAFCVHTYTYNAFALMHHTCVCSFTCASPGACVSVPAHQKHTFALADDCPRADTCACA
jgi:hypothetical protein